MGSQLLQAIQTAAITDLSQGGGQNFPVGKHPVVIVGANVEATSKGDGGMIVVEMRIIDGPMAGAVGVHRLNLYNQNPEACRIAEKQVAILAAVTGQPGVVVSDIMQLSNRPFAIEVGLQRNPEAAEKGYTEIKKFLDINGNEPGKAPQQQQQPQAGFAAPPPPAAAPAAWGGGQQAGAPAASPAPAPAWGAGAPAAPAAAPAGAPAWGGGQQAQAPAAAPAQWSPNGGGAAAGGGAPAWASR